MNKTSAKRVSLFKFLLLLATFLPAVFSFGQDKGTFTDPRDSHTYRWVLFGKQAWILGNLNYKTQAGSWVYNNDSTREAGYGRLYDWTTAQKACPKGWHLPTESDWNNLISFLGGADAAGGKFQALDSLPAALRKNRPGEVPDNFIALLGGVRHIDGTFSGISLWGGSWSAMKKPNADGSVINYLFAHNGQAIAKSTTDKSSAFSVKCVRNK